MAADTQMPLLSSPPKCTAQRLGHWEGKALGGGGSERGRGESAAQLP